MNENIVGVIIKSVASVVIAFFAMTAAVNLVEKRSELEEKKIKADEEAKLPPEYWVAKTEEAKASVDKVKEEEAGKTERHKADLEFKAKEAEKEREAEATRPAEYWLFKAEEAKAESEANSRKAYIEKELDCKKQDSEYRKSQLDTMTSMVKMFLRAKNGWYV